MRLRRLVARGFRNLADLDCAVPGQGIALLGANAQGKTNAGFGSPGFHIEASVEASGLGTLAAGYLPAGRRKRILLDGDEPERLTEAVGRRLAAWGWRSGR